MNLTDEELHTIGMAVRRQVQKALLAGFIVGALVGSVVTWALRIGAS